jgi:hypothetical protein
MSSSSFSNGVGATEASVEAIAEREGERERERERERGRGFEYVKRLGVVLKGERETLCGNIIVG